ELDYTRARTGQVLTISNGTSAVYDDLYRAETVTLPASGGAAEETVTVHYDDIERVRERSSSAGAASAANIGTIEYRADASQAATAVGGLVEEYDEAGRMT